MRKVLPFTAALILSAGILAASDTMPKSASSASRGCATATMEGTIADIDHDKGAFALLGKTPSPQTFFVTADTTYRVPGVDKKN